MFNAVGLFLKPYLGYIVGGAFALVVGAFGAMAIDLALTKSALRDAQGDLKQAELTIKAQERAMEAVTNVANYRQELDRALSRLNVQIMGAEGANEQIPPAVADVWGTGIDSLRSPDSGNTGSPDSLPSP